MNSRKRIERLERGAESKKNPILIVMPNEDGTYSNSEATYTRDELTALARKYGSPVIVMDM